jgi:hypothetical protein
MITISFAVPFAQDWLPLCKTLPFDHCLSTVFPLPFIDVLLSLGPLPDQTSLDSTWDHFSPVRCDESTATCSYTNVHNQLFLYNCLDEMPMCDPDTGVDCSAAAQRKSATVRARPGRLSALSVP